MLRELGARVVPTCAALDARPDGRPDASPLLVVVERVVRGGVYGDPEIADWVRDARRLATLEHPNVARLREVVVHGQEVLVVGEFVDGVRWSKIVRAPRRVSLEIALRVLVDVLSGLSAVHNLRDGKREPLKLIHGELTPDCIVLGLDGVARVVSTCRLRSATARPGRDGSAYLAPEVLLADETADARADVYSVGVMLWEALSGRPLFPNTQPSAIVTLLLSGKVIRPSIPDGTPWAAPLAEVASRALSADPEKRFPSAAALAAELRRIAGPRVAPPVRVAAFVRAMFGDRVQARRGEIERGEARTGELSGDVPPESIPITFESSAASVVSSTAPTPVPPALHQPMALSRPPAQGNKRLAVPALRPRLPTLTGLAPPISVAPRPPEAPRPPQQEVDLRPSEHEIDVEMPSSDPPPPLISLPTPYVSFEVPSAARIPTEVVGAVETPPAPVVVPVVTAAPLGLAPRFGSSLDAPQPAARPRRGVRVALLACALVLGASAIVWWLVTRSPLSSARPQASPVTATSAASLAPPSASSSVLPQPPPPFTTPPSGVVASSTAPSSDPAPTGSASDAQTAPSAAASVTPAYPVPPRYTPPTGYAPSPSARPPGKRKYEPEGI